MSTHYILPLTIRWHDGTQQAACGQCVYPTVHSAEPTCPACAAFLERGSPRETTSVLVRQRMTLMNGTTLVTDWSASRATADQFDPGILTITADDGTVLKTFTSESWESVTVFGSDGYPDFSFRNDPALASHVEGRRLRRRSA